MISITGKITWNTLKEFKRKIEDLKEFSNTPCHIYINSPGGYARAAIGIHNMMIEKNIRFIVTGGKQIASAALIIFQGADKKICYQDSRFLLHPGKTDSKKVKKQFDAELYAMVAKSTHLTIEEAEKLALEERYVDAEEAKKLGFVHEIIKSPAPTKGGTLFFLCKVNNLKIWFFLILSRG